MSKQTEIAYRARRAIINQNGELAVSLESISITHNALNNKKALLVAPAEVNSTFTREYTSPQAGVSIVVPAANYRINLRSIFCITDAAAGAVELDFLTSGTEVFRLYATKQNQVGSGDVNLVGMVNEPLVLTTTTGNDNVFLIVNYTTCNPLDEIH